MFLSSATRFREADRIAGRNDRPCLAVPRSPCKRFAAMRRALAFLVHPLAKLVINVVTQRRDVVRRQSCQKEAGLTTRLALKVSRAWSITCLTASVVAGRHERVSAGHELDHDPHVGPAVQLAVRTAVQPAGLRGQPHGGGRHVTPRLPAHLPAHLPAPQRLGLPADPSGKLSFLI